MHVKFGSSDQSFLDLEHRFWPFATNQSSRVSIEEEQSLKRQGSGNREVSLRPVAFALIRKVPRLRLGNSRIYPDQNVWASGESGPGGLGPGGRGARSRILDELSGGDIGACLYLHTSTLLTLTQARALTWAYAPWTLALGELGTRPRPWP
jgi:hypothetical protein